MPAYRFYSLPRDACATPEERRFYDDRVALLWAYRSMADRGVEVWEGSRFVGRLHGGVTTPDDGRAESELSAQALSLMIAPSSSSGAGAS